MATASGSGGEVERLLGVGAWGGNGGCSGGQTEGTVLNLAARHGAGRWGIVYLAAPATVSVDVGRLAGAGDAVWVDPRTGATQPAGRFARTGTAAFATPDGWEDALLVLTVG